MFQWTKMYWDLLCHKNTARILVPTLFSLTWIGWAVTIRYIRKTIDTATTTTSTQKLNNVEFVETRGKEFREFCQQDSKTNSNSDPKFDPKFDPNANIHPDLYDIERYKTMIKEATTTSPIESQWKTRILFDTTPVGNVLMYYDIYKHGFAYASDQTVPYPVLCACAMKYCKLFCCKDFFRDNSYIPEEKLSPFTQMELDEEKRELEKKKEKKKNLKLDLDCDAFVKPKPNPNAKPPKPTNSTSNTTLNQYKNKAIETQPPTQQQHPQQLIEPIKNYYKNIFQYLGKTNNVCVLQKGFIPKQSQQKKITSYAEFKQQRQLIKDSSILLRC
jgi:hypothetical protein